MFRTKRNKIIAIITLVIILIFASLTVYIKVHKIDLSNMSAQEIFTFEFLKDKKVKKGSVKNSFAIEHNSYENLCVYDNHIVCYDKNGIKYLNVKDGKSIWSHTYTMVNPMAREGNNCLVIGDIGAKNVILLQDKDVLWNETLDGKIRNVNIDNKDNVVVIREDDGYKSIIDIYNKAGDKIVYMGKKNDIVVDAFLTKDEKKVILNCIVPYGSITVGRMEIVDIESKEKVKENESSDGIFTSMWHTSKGTIFALNDSSLVCYDKNGEEKYREKFDMVYSADVVNDKNLAVAVKENEETKVYTFSEKGKQKADYIINEEVDRVKAINDIVAVICKRGIYFFNDKNHYIREYRSEDEFVSCNFFDERSIVFEFFDRIENIVL